MKKTSSIVSQILLVIAFIGLLPLLQYFFGFLQKPPADSVLNVSNPAFVASHHDSASLPVRLIIPGIGLYTHIEYRGIALDGTMDLPKNPDGVAWFEPGVRPGEIGSAVIAGHFGWIDKRPTAFDRLKELKVGDRIYIEDSSGTTTISFLVRELREFDPNVDATEIFTSHDGKSHLNLITCEGKWDKKTKSYSKRLVVFTDREEKKMYY